jgi:hypothetical protein
MIYNIKNKPTRTILIHGLLTLFFLIVFTDHGLSENSGQVVLIHVKSVKTNKEFRLQSITDTSLNALKRKNRVIVFFDVKAVKAIKIGRWYGGDTTLLDKVKIKDDKRNILSNDLNISLPNIPSNYGELFRLMRGRGVELYASKNMMRALRIDDEEYDTAFTPINNDHIVDIFLDADVYISY